MVLTISDPCAYTELREELARATAVGLNEEEESASSPVPLLHLLESFTFHLPHENTQAYPFSYPITCLSLESSWKEGNCRSFPPNSACTQPWSNEVLHRGLPGWQVTLGDGLP